MFCITLILWLHLIMLRNTMQIFYRHTKKMKNNAWEKRIGGIIFHSNTFTIRGGVRHPVTDLPPATAAATSATAAAAVVDELYKSCNFL